MALNTKDMILTFLNSVNGIYCHSTTEGLKGLRMSTCVITSALLLLHPCVFFVIQLSEMSLLAYVLEEIVVR